MVTFRTMHLQTKAWAIACFYFKLKCWFEFARAKSLSFFFFCFFFFFSSSLFPLFWFIFSLGFNLSFSSSIIEFSCNPVEFSFIDHISLTADWLIIGKRSQQFDISVVLSALQIILWYSQCHLCPLIIQKSFILEIQFQELKGIHSQKHGSLQTEIR